MPVRKVGPNSYQWGNSGKVYSGKGAKAKAERQGRAIYASGYKGAESFKPPASAISNAKRGLELRKRWGRGGLSPSEAKSQGIDSGVTRARKIASGKVSTHDVRRMSAFNRHRKNYRPDKKMPDGGPTAGTIAWLLWGGTSGVNWAKKKSAAMNAEDYGVGGVWMSEDVPMTDWENYPGELPEQYPHRRPRKSGRGTEPIAGPDRKAYGEEKRRRLKARSPTLTVTKVEPSKTTPTMNDITFENGLVAGYPTSKNAKVGDKFVVANFDGMFPKIMDAEDSYDEVRELGCPICAHELHTVSASAECPYCEVLWHYHEDDGFSYFEAEGDFGDEFAVEFDDWADQEMMTHGKDVSFQEWADEEGEKHGDMNLVDWAKDEEESHDERYGAEAETMIGDDGNCVRCGYDEGFDYMGGCFTCLDVGGQELPLEAEGWGNSHINKYTWSKDPYLKRYNTLTKEEARELLETTTKPIRIRVGRSSTLYVGRGKVLPNTPQVIGRDEALAFFDNEDGSYVGVALWEYDDHIFLLATTYDEMWAESFDAENSEAFCSECGGSHEDSEKFSAEGAGGTQVFNSCWKCGSGLHLYQITRYPATPNEIAGVGGDPNQASDEGRRRA